VASLIASQKQITLPLTVSGETTSPSVGINNEKLTAESKDLLKSQLKAETGKLANDAKSTLKDMINENSTNKKTSPQKKDLKKDVNSSINKIKKLF
jgi:hypothetical protein